MNFKWKCEKLKTQKNIFYECVEKIRGMLKKVPSFKSQYRTIPLSVVLCY